MKNKESIIVIDSATVWLYLGVYIKTENNWICSNESIKKPDKENASWLADNIESFIADNFPEGNQEHTFAIGQGPGSFTGLRILFTYIRTLSMLQGSQIATFSSHMFWEYVLCNKNEMLLLQQNKNLYYGSGSKTGERKMDILQNWQKESETKKDKIVVWHGAYPEPSGTENDGWPANCIHIFQPTERIQNNEQRKLPLDFFELTTWTNATPRYEHNVLLKKKR